MSIRCSRRSPPSSGAAAESLLPWCEAHGTGVIVYSPMQAGLLTGSFTEMRAANLDDDDWRSRNDNFRGEKLQRNLALVEALKPIAERHRMPLPAVAIAWVLAWPAVTGAIVGARGPQQVDGWIGGARLTLSPDELDEVAAAIQSTGAGQGPARPAEARPAEARPAL